MRIIVRMVDQRYRKSQGAVFSLKHHLVWCPKYRLPVLIGAVADRLAALLREKAAELDTQVRAVDIMPDHVHLFIETDPTLAPAHIANQFKGNLQRLDPPLQDAMASLSAPRSDGLVDGRGREGPARLATRETLSLRPARTIRTPPGWWERSSRIAVRLRHAPGVPRTPCCWQGR